MHGCSVSPLRLDTSHPGLSVLFHAMSTVLCHLDCLEWLLSCVATVLWSLPRTVPVCSVSFVCLALTIRVTVLGLFALNPMIGS